MRTIISSILLLILLSFTSPAPSELAKRIGRILIQIIELKKEYENDKRIAYSVYNMPLDSIRIVITSLRVDINHDLLEPYLRDEIYNSILSRSGLTQIRHYNLPKSGTGRSYFVNSYHYIILLKGFYVHLIEYSDDESLAVLNTIDFKY